MNDQDDEVMKNTEALHGMSLNESEQQEQAAENNEQTGSSQRITIQYDKFNEIKLMLAHRLRLNQQESEDGKDPKQRGFEGYFFLFNLLFYYRSWNASQ
jgi:DNA replication licensing factor MCM6